MCSFVQIWIVHFPTIWGLSRISSPPLRLVRCPPFGEAYPNTIAVSPGWITLLQIDNDLRTENFSAVGRGPKKILWPQNQGRQCEEWQCMCWLVGFRWGWRREWMRLVTWSECGVLTHASSVSLELLFAKKHLTQDKTLLWNITLTT